MLGLIATVADAHIFDYAKLANYTRLLGFTPSEASNELWLGIIKDCSKRASFSCIQKNAYDYLDRTLADRDNITVFDSLTLYKNDLSYCEEDACEPSRNVKKDKADDSPQDNLIDDDEKESSGRKSRKLKDKEDEEDDGEYKAPLEEVTHALRKKTIKFLATRDYDIQLPGFIADGVNMKISPREIDATGALIRIDFGGRALEPKEEQSSGRIFILKKIKKQIQNKIFGAILLLILLIKIIKLKFMFVIPFLFGVGTAKKLFLKLLLFFVPAFAHVFKLCSSYYSTVKHHHHHHNKVAHHHHHLPVPVPVYHKPAQVYYDHPPVAPHDDGGPIILDENFQGYDYAHPHIQYRKDMEELKEWGIETGYEEGQDDDDAQPEEAAGVVYHGPPPPGTKMGSGSKVPPLPPFVMPPAMFGRPFPDKISNSLAYGAHAPNNRLPPGVLPAPSGPVVAAGGVPAIFATPYQLTPAKPVQKQQQQQQQQQPQQLKNQHQQHQQHQSKIDQQVQPTVIGSGAVAMPMTRTKQYDDKFFGPIVERLDEIFAQLRFTEEQCRERLVCSMYKNPAQYTPHSNLVSNELSRDVQELQQGNSRSESSRRFYRYFNAARLGQDRGDCLRTYHCAIKTE
ncbi:uncharacterized protein LOC106649065 [Trichogramma pretiosum]|uniref:uncharacterized protein LOC106649065 n=1 Tax=Trichogramma pretiosum TaxID=7493 RepID=UPI0006C9B162|nr:uncharacterized protein LOC106649065 [Trichogramma pretiosum]